MPKRAKNKQKKCRKERRRGTEEGDREKDVGGKIRNAGYTLKRK